LDYWAQLAQRPVVLLELREKRQTKGKFPGEESPLIRYRIGTETHARRSIKTRAERRPKCFQEDG
jgi:hypothetical protein